jgi:hypothetical protein
MSSAPSVNVIPRPHEPSTVAAILSYLVPGLGQIYQGRFGKGFLFMVALLGMFTLGQAMGNWQNVYVPPPENQPNGPGAPGKLPSSLLTRWHYLGQFWIGVYAWPALYQYFQPPPPPNAGFWENFQRTPDEKDVNEFLIKSDKTPDLGWVYTVIAGMLNILVIYDAFAGPAFLPQLRSASKEQPAAQPVAVSGGAL